MTKAQELVVNALQEINVELKEIENAIEYQMIDTNLSNFKFYVNIDYKVCGALVEIEGKYQCEFFKKVRKACKIYGLTTRYPWDYEKQCWDKSILVIEIKTKKEDNYKKYRSW